MDTAKKPSAELKVAARRLARRKHRKSWLVGFCPEGQRAIWRGMLYGNEWTTSLEETKALLRNGAKAPV